MNVVWETFADTMREASQRLKEERGSIKGQLSSFLAEHVPPKFAVSEGVVFSLDGTVTDGSDIILYDRQHTPRLPAGNVSLIPAETTGAVIQVLDVLTERLLMEEVEHLRAVRRLPKLTQKGFTGGLELMTPHPFTMGLLVVEHSELTLEEIRDQLEAGQDQWPTTERISAVVVAGVGVVLYETPATGEVRFFPVEGSRLKVLATGEDTLAFSLLYLSSYLNSIEIIPPNLITLLSQLNNLNSNPL